MSLKLCHELDLNGAYMHSVATIRHTSYNDLPLQPSDYLACSFGSEFADHAHACCGANSSANSLFLAR